MAMLAGLMIVMSAFMLMNSEVRNKDVYIKNIGDIIHVQPLETGSEYFVVSKGGTLARIDEFGHIEWRHSTLSYHTVKQVDCFKNSNGIPRMPYNIYQANSY